MYKFQGSTENQEGDKKSKAVGGHIKKVKDWHCHLLKKRLKLPLKLLECT